MNAKEILNYTYKFWKNRRTLDKSGVYTPLFETGNRVEVITPCGAAFHPITFIGKTWVYFYWIDQYHYKGLVKQEDIFKLTKRQLYNKFRQQQIVLEKSYAI